jgi:uncharacterized RDD family membrane protein YckC
MTTGFATPSGVNLALSSRWTRLVGQMIDGFFAAAPILCSVVLANIIPTLGFALAIAGVAWAAFYYFLADGLHGGQSFAKQWMGMRVVNAETGAPCTFGQSFIRNLLLSVLGPLDWVFIFGERHQRLGDKAAGTIVIVAD